MEEPACRIPKLPSSARTFVSVVSVRVRLALRWFWFSSSDLSFRPQTEARKLFWILRSILGILGIIQLRRSRAPVPRPSVPPVLPSLRSLKLLLPPMDIFCNKSQLGAESINFKLICTCRRSPSPLTHTHTYTQEINNSHTLLRSFMRREAKRASLREAAAALMKLLPPGSSARQPLPDSASSSFPLTLATTWLALAALASWLQAAVFLRAAALSVSRRRRSSRRPSM